MDRFNEFVYSTVNVLSMEGVDERAVIDSLVAKHGVEDAFLLFHAAKTYIALGPVDVPADDGVPSSGRF